MNGIQPEGAAALAKALMKNRYPIAAGRSNDGVFFRGISDGWDFNGIY